MTDLKVLIIDDDKTDRGLFRRHVRKPGADLTVLEASNAEQGLKIINENDNIDCVFLDYMLPDMDGISMLKKIYDKDTDLTPFPVVMLTGQGSESVAIDAIRFGAQDYLIKDNISTDTLYIALAKARQVFDLKKGRNEAKELLEYSQKMEAVGKLTGGIAHDFNNLLTIIFGNTRMLSDMLPDDRCDKNLCIEKVRIIQKATRRGAELVKRLMVFSRQRTLEPVTISVNNLIAELEELLIRALGDHIDIQMDFIPHIHGIDIDPGQLEHAIINLTVNARDAMIDGGTLRLTTANIDLNEERAAALGLSIGTYVRLTVSDTGSGMSPNVAAKIFDPFFTTKDVGKGTGLGLSMVYGFVKESGGAIEVESITGHGTAFTLYFPRSDSEVLTVKSEEMIPQTITGGLETILIVEDENDIREMGCDMLRDAGYTVLHAKDGIQALEIIQEKGDGIDLVFTDIAMPGDMNGVQMAARAQALIPDVKLLFTSGYASGSLPDMELSEQYTHLNKPYRPEELMSTLRHILDA